MESNYKHLSVVEDNNTLLIKDKSKTFLNAYGLAVLKIYIPENKTFDKVKINFGSSSSNLDDLRARSLDLRFGTGKALLKKITASDDAYIDTGAGQLVIRDSEFNNLKWAWAALSFHSCLANTQIWALVPAKSIYMVLWTIIIESCQSWRDHLTKNPYGATHNLIRRQAALC